MLRIGINLGDVMVEGSDLYGDSVNVAARLEGIAEPGGILAFRHDLLITSEAKINIVFDDIGPAISKEHISSQSRAYRVAGTSAATTTAPKLASNKPSSRGIALQ